MTSKDIFSVTELRTNPIVILERSQDRPQFIFRNNKMLGVFISPLDYDAHFAAQGNTVVLHEMEYDDLTATQKKEFDRVGQLDSSTFTSYTLEDYAD